MPLVKAKSTENLSLPNNIEDINDEEEEQTFSNSSNNLNLLMTKANSYDNKTNEENYQNTLNVVYNSANNEFILRNNLDKKRKKLEIMLGINNIPQINTYDDIGTPIQQNLENIEKLKEENLKIKTLIINQKINNENMEKNIEKK